MFRRLAFAPLVLLLLASVASAQVRLEQKFTPDTAVSSTETAEIEQKLTIAGMALETSARQTVISLDEYFDAGDGAVDIDSTVEAISADMQLPGGMAVTFDSRNPEGSTANEALQPLIDIMREMVQKTVTYRISADREVESVEGEEELVPDLPAELAQFMGDETSEENLILDLQQRIDVFPTSPVSPQDSWTRTEVWSVGGGQTLTFDRRYTYEGTVEQDGKTYDRVTVVEEAVRYAWSNPAVPLTVKDSSLKIESSEGELLLDRETGHVARRRVTTHITGTMTFVAGGMDLPSELDLKMTRTTVSAPAEVTEEQE